jgi:hypothetical protein
MVARAGEPPESFRSPDARRRYGLERDIAGTAGATTSATQQAATRLFVVQSGRIAIAVRARTAGVGGGGARQVRCSASCHPSTASPVRPT